MAMGANATELSELSAVGVQLSACRAGAFENPVVVQVFFDDAERSPGYHTFGEPRREAPTAFAEGPQWREQAERQERSGIRNRKESRLRENLVPCHSLARPYFIPARRWCLGVISQCGTDGWHRCSCWEKGAAGL